MTLDSFLDFCATLKATSHDMPFDDKVLVYRVKGKMFALVDIDEFESVNLKCDPEKAILLREQYPAVTPGYHMNKKHWNTVLNDGSIPDPLLKEWIVDSYHLVIKTLPKKEQAEFGDK